MMSLCMESDHSILVQNRRLKVIILKNNTLSIKVTVRLSVNFFSYPFKHIGKKNTYRRSAYEKKSRKLKLPAYNVSKHQRGTFSTRQFCQILYQNCCNGRLSCTPIQFWLCEYRLKTITAFSPSRIHPPAV